MNIHKYVVMAVVAAVQVMSCQIALAADGGVGFSRNRLVYLSTDKAINLSVYNHDSSPYLVQAGVSGESRQNTKAPFIVTPPLFRLEGHGNNVMRIMSAGANLPIDRESVFYFYATTIPAREKPAGSTTDESDRKVGASVSVSIKTILKLFWRPEGLPYTQESSTKLLRFVNEGKALVVKNPTPYYQSFAILEFDGRRIDTNAVPSMVAPFSELRFPVTGAVSKVTWNVMDDYGGTTPLVTGKVVVE